MSNRIIDMESLITIYSEKLDHRRKWWQFWKPKISQVTHHYSARINRTGEHFTITNHCVRMLTPILESMEIEIRKELAQ